MGFSGVVLAAVTQSAVVDLARAHGLTGTLDPDDETDDAGLSGWRVGTVEGVDHAPDRILLRLATTTGGPVLCADVLDSEVAFVRLVGPAGVIARFVLGAADPHARHTAEAVVGWAGRGDPDAVTSVLATRYVFAEDGVFDLCVAVGILEANALAEPGAAAT